MSNSESSENLLRENEWAFVDMRGAIVPQNQVQSSKGMSKKTKKKFKQKKARKDDGDSEPEFEVIQENKLTMSAIMDETKLPPFEKDQDINDDEWGMVATSQENSKMIDNFHSNLQDQKLQDPSSEEIEFIQIPEKQNDDPVEHFSDSSSTSSFDVINENKTKHFTCDETNEASLYSRIDEVNSAMDVTFNLDFPTLVALFCLTTALGFVIGHGIGIATSLLVVKSPSLKILPKVTEPKTSDSLPEETIKKSEDSQLEGKIQKWKSIYRNDRTRQRQYDNISDRASQGSLPGLKEAHQHLSLENFKLKLAQEDIQRKLDLMKVMSWHWRSQLDNMKTEAKLNKSYVLNILRKELEYLEEVYVREKRLADMWRNEEQQKVRKRLNYWKDFKERWNQQHKRAQPSEDIDRPYTSHEDTTIEKGVCEGTCEDIARSTLQKVEIDKEEEESFPQYHKYVSENLFLRHILQLKNIEDEKVEKVVVELREEDGDNELKSESTEDTSSSRRDGGDMYSSVARNDFVENKNEATGDEELKETEYEEKAVEDGQGIMSEVGDDHASEWYTKEVREIDGDIVVAYENRDVTNHKLYGFIDGSFREILSAPGDVFVMSMKKKCLDATVGFVLSVENNSPAPIDFFAVLPNGKVKHQQITDGVKIVLVHLGEATEEVMVGETSEKHPLVYEAVVLADGQLVVSPQKDDQQEEAEQNNMGEAVTTSDAKYEEDPKETTKVEANTETEETPLNHETDNSSQTEPDSFLAPGESFIYEHCTGKVYRRLVSVHQYPISEYQNVLSHNPGKEERVFYRFPRNMIFENFVVKDITMKEDGTENENEELVEETGSESMEPVLYDKEVLNIVKTLLESRWQDGNKVPVLMSYDSATGTVTSTYVTICNVKHNEVISREELKYGKTVKNGRVTEMTSYRMTGYKLVRIIRADELYTDLADEPQDQDSPAVESINDSETEEENESIPENEDSSEKNGASSEKSEASSEKSEASSEKNEDNFEKTEDSSEKNKDTSEKHEDSFEKNEDSFEKNDRSSEKYGDTYEKNEDSSQNGINSMKRDQQSHSNSVSEFMKDEEELLTETKSNELCNLKLGESDETEYWTSCSLQKIVLTKEKVERVKETLNFKEEDMEKLNVSTEHVEETVSYVYCGDGTIQKTWRRIERRMNEGVVDHSEEKNTEDLDKEDGKLSSEEDGRVESNVNNVPKNDDLVGKLEAEKLGDWGNAMVFDDDNTDDYDYSNDDDDDYDDDDDDEDGEEEDHDDILNSRKRDGPPNAHWNNQETLEQEKPSKSKISSNSGKPMQRDLRKTQINEKAESYEKYFENGWRNLKMRQRHFEYSEEQNLRLQKRMSEEWKRMKVEHGEFLMYFKKFQESKVDEKTEGVWEKMKYKQQRFDNWKTQAMEELKESLKKEWEKLQQKHREIEMKEKQLRARREAFFQSYKTESVEYPKSNMEESGREAAGISGDVDIQGNQGTQSQREDPGEMNADVDGELSEAWELHDTKKNYGQVQVSRGTQKEDPAELDGDVNEELALERDTTKNEFVYQRQPGVPQDTPGDPDTNGNVDEMISRAWELEDMNGEPVYNGQPQGTPKEDPTEMNGNVDEMISRAWELEDMNGEPVYNGQPQGTPKEDPAKMNGNVDEMNNAAWELLDANQDQDPSKGTLSRDEPSQMNGNVDETLSAAWELRYGGKNDKHAQATLTKDREAAETNNLAISETTITKDDTAYPKSQQAGEASTHVNNGGAASSPTQWAIHVRRLRDELDRLYETKFGVYQRNGNELQVTSQEAKSDWSMQQNKPTDSQSAVKKSIQPKCPPKCPRDTEESDPRDLAREVILSPEGPPAEKEPEKMNTAERSMENGYALMDFIRSYKYLNELQARQDSDESLELMNAPLPPEDREFKAPKKKKHAHKYGHNYQNLVKKSKKKKQQKKREIKKVKQGHDSNDYDQRNKKERKKAAKQIDRSFENRMERKKTEKKDERLRAKWVRKVK